MSFEDDFPSFKQYTDEDDWSELINWDEDSRGYDKEEIKEAMIENCLDKQKVREAIENIFNEWYISDAEEREKTKEYLLKELGL